MKKNRAVRFILRTLLVLFTTIILLCAAVVGIVWVVLRGPSPAAQELMTRSLK